MSDEDSSPVSSVSDLSEFEKGQIVGAYLAGLSVEDVSQMCNVSSQTVSEILDLYKLFLSITPGLKRRTAPAKATNTRKRIKKGETCNGRTEKTEEDGTEEATGDKVQSSDEKDDLQTSTEDGQ